MGNSEALSTDGGRGGENVRIQGKIENKGGTQHADGKMECTLPAGVIRLRGPPPPLSLPLLPQSGQQLGK